MKAQAALKRASLTVFVATSGFILTARLTAKPKVPPPLPSPPPVRVAAPVKRSFARAPREFDRARVERELRAIAARPESRVWSPKIEAGIVKKWIGLLDHDDPDVRRGLLQLMSRHRAEDTLAVRVALLRPLASEEAQSWALLRAAVDAGRRLGPEFRRVMLARIAEGLGSPRATVRLNAARSLGLFGAPSEPTASSFGCGFLPLAGFSFPDCEATWRRLVLEVAENDGPETEEVLRCAYTRPFAPFLLLLQASRHPERRQRAREVRARMRDEAQRRHDAPLPPAFDFSPLWVTGRLRFL